MKYFLFALVFFWCFSLFAQSLTEELLTEEQITQKVLALSYELRCPVCQGLSVKESMNAISVNMKHKIRSLLLEGKNHQEILTFFEQRYGEWILRNPKKTGWNLSLWLVPLTTIFLASLIVFLTLKRKYSKLL